MIDVAKNFDGTIENTVEAAKSLSGKWKIVQDFMTFGDFETGLSKKIDGTIFGDTSNNGANLRNSLIDNYAAQLATLDKSSQRVVLRATELNAGIQDIIQSALDATAAGQKMNSVLFEQTASEWKAKQPDIDTMMFIGQMKDNNGMYKLTDYTQVIDRINKWATANKNANIVQRLLTAGILEENNGLIQLDATYLKDIAIKNANISATKKLITKQMALNAVMQIGKQLLFSLAITGFMMGVKAIYNGLTQISEKISDTAKESKEQAEEMTSISSSLSDIIKQYEQIGNKTHHTAEEAETLKSLQEEITTLLKDQPNIGDSMLKQVNLQNASYETQLQLLKDIEEQQRINARKELEENVDDQGDLLSEAYKKKGQAFSVGSSSGAREIAKRLSDAGLGDISDGSFMFNADIDDTESIAESYSKAKKIFDDSRDEFTDQELSGLKGWLKTLKQYVTDYNNAVDQLHDNNLPDIVSENLEKLTNQKNARNNTFTPVEEMSFDDEIKSTKEYTEAYKKLQEAKKAAYEEGAGKYGNVNNLTRDRIEWTDENKKTYSAFAEEHPDDVAGEYSTVLGTSEDIDGHEVAFTPMLQTESGLIPLTEDQLWDYLDDIIAQCENEDGEIDFNKLLKLDATGLEKEVNGEMVRIKGIIAGIEGTEQNGKILSKADVMAMAGAGAQELALASYNRSHGNVDGYTYNVAHDPLHQSKPLSHDFDAENIASSYVGKSMHDVQGAVSDAQIEVDRVYNELEAKAKEAYQTQVDESKKAADEQTSDYDEIKDAVDTLRAGISGFDTTNLTSLLNSDGSNLGRIDTEALEKLKTTMKDIGFDPENTEDVAAFVDILKQLEIVAPSADEKQQELAQSVKDAETQMTEASQAIDDLQKGYQTCKTAAEEYNKTGYVSMDTLQSLTALGPQYLSMLMNENGQLEINTESAKKLTAATIQTQRAALLAKTLTNIQQTNTLESAQKVLNEAKAAIGDAKTQLLTASYDSAQKVLEDTGDFDAMQTVLKANNEQIRQWEMLDGLWADMQKKDPDSILSKPSKSGKSKNSSKTQKTALDAWSALSSAMKEYNEQGYITMQTLKSLTDLEDKYNSMLKKNDTNGQLEIRTDLFYDLIKAELKEAQTKGDGASEARYNKILEWTDRNIKDQTMSYWDLVAAIEGYSAALSQAKEITDGFKDAWDNGKTVKEKTEKSRTGALDYEGTEAQSAALQSIKKYSQYDPNLINKAYNKDTGKIDLSGDVLKDAVVNSLKEQAKGARTEGGAAAEAIAKSYEIAANNIEHDVISVQDYFDGLGSTVEEFSSKIDDMQSAWTDLSDVTNEYNTYGGLSIDSIQKLLTMSPEYLQFLKLEGNQLVFNKEAMLAKTKADILAKAAELELKEETKDQAEILRALADSLDKGADSMEGMGKSADKLKTLMSQLNTVLNSFIGVFDDLNDKQSNDLKIQGEAWIDVIDKRIDALNEENDAQERSIELAKLQDEYERAKANKTVHVYGGRGQGFVWKADENAVREAGQNLSDKQREYKKKDEIDKLEKLKDKVQETNNLIGTSWDDYQKKLKYTAEFEAMTFEQMEGHYDGFKGSVLNNMQAIQGATNVKNVITDISNLISTLETLANILNILNGGSGDGGGVFGFINQIKNMFTGENGDFDLGGGFKKMFDGAAKVVSDGWNWITGKNRAGSAALKSDTTATLDILGNTIKVNTGDIQRVSGGFFERLVGAAKDNLGSIGKFFSGA